MTPDLSANTQAILLLTAPLIVDARGARRRADTQPLSHGEYGKLASRLYAASAAPRDLLEPSDSGWVSELEGVFDIERLKRLLGRGFLLSQAADRWRSRAIWVVSRADEGYPQRVKEVLKTKAPAILYGCGEPPMLETPGLAIVGSRDADAEALAFAEEVASRVAATGRAVVSGGARGVDRAAMTGALEGGGRVVGVLAERLERTSMNREHRDLLVDERLVLVSPYDPQAGFHVGQAMQRNKLIYALADAGLVVDAAVDKGGTWAGAIEQLDIYGRAVFVRDSGRRSEGLDALRDRGARPWPDLADEATLDELLRSSSAPGPCAERQLTLPAIDATDADQQSDVTGGATEAADESTVGGETVGEELFGAIRSLVTRVCVEPRTGQEIAKALDVPKALSDRWLKRLVDENAVIKDTRPVRYTSRQRSLPGFRT